MLGRLREEFPDVTISKIRFLEAEGLVTPARTDSGYRQFNAADVERLRFVLAAQRDHYLPLRVIREQLDAADAAVLAEAPAPQAALTSSRSRATRTPTSPGWRTWRGPCGRRGRATTDESHT